MTRFRELIFVLLAMAAAAALFSFWWESGNQPPHENESLGSELTKAERPIAVRDDGYVGSESCQECHQEAYDTWHASYHRTMTQVANPQSVVAPFDGQQLEYGTVKYDLRKKGDEYWVDSVESVTAATTTKESRRVMLTTGSHHLQAYWLATDRGRQLDLFPLFYRLDEKRWIPDGAVFLLPPEFESYREPGMWNLVCSRCHSTAAQPRMAADGSHADTQVAEFGISCEACHGPAEQHIKNVTAEIEDLAIVNPAELPPLRSTQVCGHCHGMTGAKPGDDGWMDHGWSFKPGEKLEDHRRIVHANEYFFWPDGMIRVSGREYNGLLQSPCHTHGDTTKTMTCISCHELHKKESDDRSIDQWTNDLLKPDMDSNLAGVHTNIACTQCHQDYVDDKSLTAHTHHAATSSGSTCYNCHMPHTSWGVMKAMRSHTVSSPSVAESLHPVRRPNACNLCHLDKTLAWTADGLQRWYGQSIPDLSQIEKQTAASILWASRGDAGQRAITAWSMGWDLAQDASGKDWMAPLLAELFIDPYDLVRFRAFKSLETLPEYAGLSYDFLGSPEARADARIQVLDAWERLKGSRRGTPELLLDEDGSLLRAQLDQLLQQRDDRPVHLFE